MISISAGIVPVAYGGRMALIWAFEVNRDVVTA